MIQGVTHLIDDDADEDVRLMVGHMTASPLFAGAVTSRTQTIRQGRMAAPILRADVIVSHLPVSWSNLAFLTSLRAQHPDRPIIHVEHRFGEAFAAGMVGNRPRFDALLGAAYSLFDRVVALNSGQRSWMLRHGYCPAERLAVIAPCAGLSDFLAAPPRTPSRRIVLSAIGRFDDASGFDILVDAVAGLERKDVLLRLHGDTAKGGADARPELRAKAETRDNILISASPMDRPALIASSDALLIPSRWHACSLVALQAMAAGRPVLVARGDAGPDLARAGAFVIHENTSRGWRETLQALDLAALDRSPARRHAKTAEARFAAAWIALLAAVSPVSGEERGRVAA